RQLSQEVLAGLVGRTTDWLSKIENGRANLERLSVIKCLADALDVTVGDLLGEPAIVDWTADSGARTVSLLREALMDYPSLTGTLGAATADHNLNLHAEIADVWGAYQASRFGYTTTRLPKVIATARRAVDTADGDVERQQAFRMLALAYHAAAATLTKVGEADLSWIASDRGLNAAEMSQDLPVQGSLLRSVAHALLSNGRYTAAADVVSRATDRLEGKPFNDRDLRWSLLGSLHLVGAMAAARTGTPADARSFLARARQAAAHLGHDGNHGWTAFGPTNVAVHDLSVAVALGDMQTALAIAPRVDVRALPVERRVRHGLEVARVYAMTNRETEALDVILASEREAPEQVRYHYLARELVLFWMRRRGTPRPELIDLAHRLRVA
ncbi:MAG: helix-turn-helix domain-containing protein, partial [Dermatophilaceae bacterium]